MEQWIVIGLLALWLPPALRQSLLWLHWIQVKEYRTDRFRELVSTPEGRTRVELPLIALKTAAALIAVLGGGQPLALLPYAALLVVINGRLAYEGMRHLLRRPVFTLRANEILATQAVGLLIVVVLILSEAAVAPALLLGELLLITLPFLGIAWTYPLVQRTKHQEIALARQRLAQVNPTVVGITGSYGKSTTKEFTYHLLAQHFRTAKTPTSINTDFGVARNTKALPDGIEYYVVESGAYKIGEVKAVVDFVQPHLGLVTGVEPQHLMLFGSFENIITAKSEMPLGTRQGGTAVFNYSNATVRQMARDAGDSRPDLTIRSYYLHKPEESAITADCVSRVIRADARGVTFEVSHNGDTHTLTAPVNGVHFVENLTGAILVARLFGVPWDKITAGVATIQMPKQTMQVYDLRNGVSVVDDSYNATPKGFESALKYLALFPNRRRFVITSGIIELGNKAYEIHQTLGQQMVTAGIEQVILIDTTFADGLRAGLGEQASMLHVVTREEQARPLLDALASDTVLLLEGRLPVYITRWIQAHRQESHA